MRESLGAFLTQFPVVTLFGVVGVGYLLGQIRILGFRLGVAGVLFAGLVAGAIGPTVALPAIVSTVYAQTSLVSAVRCTARVAPRRSADMLATAISSPSSLSATCEILPCAVTQRISWGRVLRGIASGSGGGCAGSDVGAAGASAASGDASATRSSTTAAPGSSTGVAAAALPLPFRLPFVARGLRPGLAAFFGRGLMSGAQISVRSTQIGSGGKR